MTTQECACGKPTAGAELCSDCARTLAFAIANVAGHYDDLANVAAKRTKYGSTATKGSIGKSQPLVVDMRFVSRTEPAAHPGANVAPLTQLRWDAWNTVVAWCRVVMEEQAAVQGPPCNADCLHVSCHVIRVRRWPRNTIGSMCLYLDRQHRWIEGRDWATAMLDEFLDLERRLTRAVNRPADKWYAGKCSALIATADAVLCHVDLYATVDRGEVKCPGCGTHHDVARRREILLSEASHVLVTATEAAHALIAWTDYDGSQTKLVDRIRKWRDREQLDVRDVSSLLGQDRHLYRLGDIQKLLVGHAQAVQAQRLDV